MRVSFQNSLVSCVKAANNLAESSCWRQVFMKPIASTGVVKVGWRDMLLLIIALYRELDCKNAPLIFPAALCTDTASLCFHKRRGIGVTLHASTACQSRHPAGQCRGLQGRNCSTGAYTRQEAGWQSQPAS